MDDDFLDVISYASRVVGPLTAGGPNWAFWHTDDGSSPLRVSISDGRVTVEVDTSVEQHAGSLYEIAGFALSRRHRVAINHAGQPVVRA